MAREKALSFPPPASLPLLFWPRLVCKRAQEQNTYVSRYHHQIDNKGVGPSSFHPWRLDGKDKLFLQLGPYVPLRSHTFPLGWWTSLMTGMADPSSAGLQGWVGSKYARNQRVAPTDQLASPPLYSQSHGLGQAWDFTMIWCRK